VDNVNNIIAPKLIGMDVTDQTGIDNLMVQTLDGTTNEWGWCKAKLGANAILAVSMAVCRAGAAASEMPLYQYLAKLGGKPMDKFVMPVPCLNVINGGTHAGNRLACQEFMICPTGAASFREGLNIGIGLQSFASDDDLRIGDGVPSDSAPAAPGVPVTRPHRPRVGPGHRPAAA